MIDKNLIRGINSGRCFAFIGSGPSSEKGYPSWSELAQRVYSAVRERKETVDSKSCDRYIEDKKYPEFFKQIEREVGNRVEFINIVKEQFFSINNRKGLIYDLLCKWPFACYLTTNYDDEISSHLWSLDILSK